MPRNVLLCVRGFSGICGSLARATGHPRSPSRVQSAISHPQFAGQLLMAGVADLVPPGERKRGHVVLRPIFLLCINHISLCLPDAGRGAVLFGNGRAANSPAQVTHSIAHSNL